MRLAGFALLMLCSSWYHPIHVSVCNIDLEPGEGSVDLSIKVFLDDFQDLIFELYSVQLELTDQIIPRDKIQAVNTYFGEALQLEINGKDLGNLIFVKSEINEEAVWFHYRKEFGEKIRKVSIRNGIMLQKFEDQTNLLIVTYADIQNGYRMDNKNTEIAFNIK